MNLTIKDVAYQAGVSVATAARALTGHLNVSAKARDLVFTAAASLGYQPDQIARSLRRSTPNMLGAESRRRNAAITGMPHIRQANTQRRTVDDCQSKGER